VKKNIFLIGGIFALAFSLAANLYFLIRQSSGKKIREYKPPVAVEQPLILISPLKQAEISESPEVLHYVYLKPKLDEAISKVEGIEDIGIFLQDSRSGAWLGMNEKTGFVPASLLKVPVMMAILKKFERGEMTSSPPVEGRSIRRSENKND